MTHKYHTLPLQADRLTAREPTDTCTLYQSIRQNIYLLLTTYIEECDFEPAMGCILWDIDFMNTSSDVKLRSILQETLTHTIMKYEKRLELQDITVTMKQQEHDQQQLYRIKKRIDLTVIGTIRKTREPFSYTEQMYIGPLSY